METLRGTNRQYLSKLQMYILFNSTIPFLGICSSEILACMAMGNVQECLQQLCLRWQQFETLLNSHQQENDYIVVYHTMEYSMQEVK